ncbi:EFR1 family ferrodoxin, partial [Bacteroides sp.]
MQTKLTPKRLVFFFTGTGNSLYIARELSGDGNEPVSMAQAIHAETNIYQADEIGLIFPTYGQVTPGIVQDFLSKVKLETKYLFAVITYGNRCSNAADLFHKLAQSFHHEFDYVTTLLMVDNYLPAFDMNEQKVIDKHIPEQLQRIKNDLVHLVNSVDSFTDEDVEWHNKLMQLMGLEGVQKPFVVEAEKLFEITDACNGCGICQQVCPKGNYHVSSNRSQCSGLCESCYACIQNCPHKAITLKPQPNFPFPPEVNPQARYRNPNVSLTDIIKANR